MKALTLYNKLGGPELTSINSLIWVVQAAVVYVRNENLRTATEGVSCAIARVSFSEIPSDSGKNAPNLCQAQFQRC
jgi:hypothetical protein